MKNDGVPITPNPLFSISLRDWLAGIALQSLIIISKDALISYQDLIEEAYKYANGMLLEKKKQDTCDDN